MHEIHPVDRLAQVRADIRRLREEAERLRREIITGAVDRVGDYYSARIERHVVMVELPEAALDFEAVD